MSDFMSALDMLSMDKDTPELKFDTELLGIFKLETLERLAVLYEFIGNYYKSLVEEADVYLAKHTKVANKRAIWCKNMSTSFAKAHKFFSEREHRSEDILKTILYHTFSREEYSGYPKTDLLNSKFKKVFLSDIGRPSTYKKTLTAIEIAVVEKGIDEIYAFAIRACFPTKEYSGFAKAIEPYADIEYPMGIIYLIEHAYEVYAEEFDDYDKAYECLVHIINKN